MTGRSYTSSADQRYKFTGKERDASTGLDYFGARYYDSWRGQWLQVDPMSVFHPEWNSYNYTYDNPIDYIDPAGKDTLNVNLPKNRKQEGTATLIVNGKIIQLNGGNRVLGKGKKQDPTKTYGDTPTGTALVTGVKDNDPNGKYVDKNGTPTKLGLSGNLPYELRAEGRFFLILSPESGQISEVDRTEIGAHGGGTILGEQALNPEQRLVGTLGCLRFTNNTDAQLAGQANDAIQNGRVFRIIINQDKK